MSVVAPLPRRGSASAGSPGMASRSRRSRICGWSVRSAPGRSAPGSVGHGATRPGASASARREVTEVSGSFRVTGEVGMCWRRALRTARAPQNTVFATPWSSRAAGSTGLRITPIAQMSDGLQSGRLAAVLVLIEISDRRSPLAWMVS